LTSKTSFAPRVWLALFAAIFVSVFVLVGCNKQAQHPDVKDAVNSAMTQNGLGVVNVSQDRDKGVITLSGDVETPDKKAEAESLARQAASGYTIANEIGVRPIGQEGQAKSVDKNLDSAIEDNFKADLKEHKNLDDQSVHYTAENGTLVLKGSVKTAAQRAEAGRLAKSVPNVKEVVNELKVDPNKHSTTASAD
jgi:hyperosmotically inducible protein